MAISGKAASPSLLPSNISLFSTVFLPEFSATAIIRFDAGIFPALGGTFPAYGLDQPCIWLSGGRLFLLCGCGIIKEREGVGERWPGRQKSAVAGVPASGDSL